MKLIILLLSLLIFTQVNLLSQIFKKDFPLAHTFSIVAFDSATGDMGVAVQSHWFSVGTIVTWGEAGVGVIATQSFVNPDFGPDGLKLLKDGLSPKEVVDKLIPEDEGRDFRQLAVLDSKGRVAAYTGKKCIESAGDVQGTGFSAQANMMLNENVWPAMAKSFNHSKGTLDVRLVAALEAAQKAGGDIRGKQSAALLVVSGKSTGKVWKDRKVDLRVEDSIEPIKEIKRLLKVHQAYEHMNNGDLAVEKNNMKLAMEEYSAAEKMFPDNLEMKYWKAVTLANNGELEKSLPIFKRSF